MSRPADAPAELRAGLHLTDKVRFPDLPITARLVDLANAIDEHQVIIVAGETGSGKTTQLPKICLAMGRGAHGLIGCTQPRRIAATSVAARVAQELDTELGDVVGYKIRFDDRIRRDSWIKFMTDGILLAELEGDPLLRAYDTLIIDEAHERSLNIDFLLGYLTRILPRRPDLRVIISSATLATERFSEFFGGAPVVEVSGRTFPVDVLYRPPHDDEGDLADTVANVVNEITELDPRGDILVFLPGEREIRDAMVELEQRALPHTVLVPLYARLSAADQQRAFRTLPQRRVVLATNVAETSLTIPGIIYVVDAGLARMNRYVVRTGVTQLLVEPVSRASADQRKGRCGRTASGVCFRLYEEEDYETRPLYTDPEIQRVGLAGVILRMTSMRLGDVATFPFIDPPQKRSVDEGYRVLEELGALDVDGTLTPIGVQLARLPVDPRLGRMILGGRDEGALREVLVLAAVLGLQDPRERPLAAQQKADEAHRRFRDETSDFIGLLKLWDFWQEARRTHKKSALLRLCRDTFLSARRMREWEDLHEQISRVAREFELRPSDGKASGDQIHRALLPGLLSKIGMWNQNQRVYNGARQTRFLLHPSSALARKPTPWVMAAELVETSQLFARSAARIDPAWIERAAGPLCKRSHGPPHWEQKQAQVMVKEHVTLYGLPVLDRRVAYGPIDPDLSRRVFIDHALVRHELTTKAPFMAHNRALLDEVQHLRDKARRSDMLADDLALARFFDERIPDHVHSGATFEAWRKTAEARDPRLLELTLPDVLLDEAHELSAARYPDELTALGVTLPLRYCFDPSLDEDGITVTVPLAGLPQLDPAVFDWTIPGWMVAKLGALLEALPRAVRKTLAPLDELAYELAIVLTPFHGPLLPALERAIHERTGERVARDAWDLRGLPPYLGFNFRIVDERDRTLGQGRDLGELQRTLAGRARDLWDRAPRERHERSGLTTFDLDELPVSVNLAVGGRTLLAYPALVDRETAVDVRLLESIDAASEATRVGLRRLFLLQLRTTVAKQEAMLPGTLTPASLAAPGAPLTPRRQVVLRAIDEAFGLADPAEIPRTRDAFAERLVAGRAALPPTLAELGRTAADLSVDLDAVRAALKLVAGKPGPWRAAHDDMQSQLAHLVPADLMLNAPPSRLRHLPRYLRAMKVRIERLEHDPHKDQTKAGPVVALWQTFVATRDGAVRRGLPLHKLAELGWLLEELRVQTFAPELKTAVPVSIKRIQELWPSLAG